MGKKPSGREEQAIHERPHKSGMTPKSPKAKRGKLRR
jgi:hypothetical protein